MEKFSFLSEVSRRTRTESPVLDRASAKLVSARSGNSRVRRKRMLCGPYAEREQLVPSMKRECSYCKCSDLSTAGREKNVRGLGGGKCVCQARRERCASTTRRACHVGNWVNDERLMHSSEVARSKIQVLLRDIFHFNSRLRCSVYARHINRLPREYASQGF